MDHVYQNCQTAITDEAGNNYWEVRRPQSGRRRAEGGE